MRFIEAFHGKIGEIKVDPPKSTPESPHDVLIEKLLEDIKSGFIAEYYTDPPEEDDEFLWKRRLSVVLKKGRKKFLVKLDKFLPNGNGYLQVEDYVPEMTKPNYDTRLREMNINEENFWCMEGYWYKTSYKDGGYHLSWTNRDISPENARQFSSDIFGAHVDHRATKQYYDLWRKSAEDNIDFRWPRFEGPAQK